MNKVIERFKDVIIQIATPYSTGTGFYLKKKDLIITNEHVVRGNREVIVDGALLPKQLAPVVYTDTKYDLAFLNPRQLQDMPEIKLAKNKTVSTGDTVVAIGHPFGLKFTATQGIISNTLHQQNDIRYLQHDAALNPGNSGGPLIDKAGEIIGINTFIIQQGDNIGFSLPVEYLEKTIEEFEQGGRKTGSRCEGCSALVFEDTIDQGYCPNCGTKITLPSDEEEYEPVGIARTIESILESCGHDTALSRRGPHFWEVQQGSAKINITYYEPNGLIAGDAIICELSKENIKATYEYLLRQCHDMEGLAFSVKGFDIILSLIIFDRHLNIETGLKQFKYLFEKADYYDNILVEQFKAKWKGE